MSLNRFDITIEKVAMLRNDIEMPMLLNSVNAPLTRSRNVQWVLLVTKVLKVLRFVANMLSTAVESSH